MASIIKSNTYADFNGREILTANNDGALTTQKINYPAFMAEPSADQTISTASWTKLTYATEIYDTDSAFSDSKFTVPTGKAGKYFFRAVYFTTLSNSNTIAIRFFKNGSFENTSYVSQVVGAAASVPAISSFIFDLAEGDYIEAYGYQNTGSNATSNKDYMFFSGYRIGS